MVQAALVLLLVPSLPAGAAHRPAQRAAAANKAQHKVHGSTSCAADGRRLCGHWRQAVGISQRLLRAGANVKHDKKRATVSSRHPQHSPAAPAEPSAAGGAWACYMAVCSMRFTTCDTAQMLLLQLRMVTMEGLECWGWRDSWTVGPPTCNSCTPPAQAASTCMTSWSSC